LVVSLPMADCVGQFAYSLAAAHLRLSHQTSVSLMVSDATSTLHLEDWSYVDGLDASTLCRHDVTTQRDMMAPTVNQSKAPIPHVLHYCQEYGVGHWYFSKYHHPEDFLSCEHPLYRIPPADLAASALSRNQTHYYIPPRDLNVTFKHPEEVIRSAFSACTLLRALNAAAVPFKSRHCSADNANLNETFAFHSADNFPPLR
jgi:peptidyl serine alpha-galactosyltransferase